MKSKFFSRFNINDERNKEFVTDLRDFIGLEKKEADFLLSQVVPFSLCRYMYERDVLVEKIAKQRSLDLSRVKNSLAVLRFFLERIVDADFAGDSVDLWISDLKESEIMNSNEIGYFQNILKNVWSIALNDYKMERKKENALIGVLPNFQGVSHSVELRGVLENDYHPGMDIKSYSPQIIDVVPIISIRIAIQSESQKEMIFQASKRDIQDLINDLNIALMESDKLAKITDVKR